jgi:hypothetical protein
MNSNLSEMMKAQTPTPQISMRLLVEINNSIPVVEDPEIKDQIIHANVRFFSGLSHLDKEKFVQRIVEQFEQITYVKENSKQNTSIVL